MPRGLKVEKPSLCQLVTRMCLMKFRNLAPVFVSHLDYILNYRGFDSSEGMATDCHNFMINWFQIVYPYVYAPFYTSDCFLSIHRP